MTPHERVRESADQVAAIDPDRSRCAAQDAPHPLGLIAIEYYAELLESVAELMRSIEASDCGIPEAARSQRKILAKAVLADAYCLVASL